MSLLIQTVGNHSTFEGTRKSFGHKSPTGTDQFIDRLAYHQFHITLSIVHVVPLTTGQQVVQTHQLNVLAWLGYILPTGQAG